MKELSIEEKAKAYDKVVESAKTEKEKSRNLGLLEFIDENFPELKESEDEKIIHWIRKELETKYVTDNIVNDVMADKAFAWLVKQSKASKVEEAMREVEEKAKEFTETHKGETSEEILAQMRGEKPDDKVEPKFKVNDWVVCVAAPKYTAFKSGDVVQITAENIHFFSMLESCFEKWDIKHANDGDVLYEKETEVVFLFKAVYCGWVETYCDFWAYKSRFEQGERQYGVISEMDVCPATAEQRETLFTAMREAGYRWDSEKLELKKISQEYPLTHDECIKPTVFSEQKTAWSEEDETIKNNISHIIRQYDKISKKENQSCWYAGDCLLWIQNIKGRVQPQSTWKPSDEQMEALKHYVDTTMDGEIDLLYQDLKKLMEE